MSDKKVEKRAYESLLQGSKKTEGVGKAVVLYEGMDHVGKEGPCYGIVPVSQQLATSAKPIRRR